LVQIAQGSDKIQGKAEILPSAGKVLPVTPTPLGEHSAITSGPKIVSFDIS